jgi:hypothetical protein
MIFLQEQSLILQQTKHARRLYVGGIPPGTTEDQIERFFTDVINRAITFVGASNPGGDPPGSLACVGYAWGP